MLKLLIGFILGAMMAVAVAKGPCYLQFDPQAMPFVFPESGITFSAGGGIEIPCPTNQP